MGPNISKHAAENRLTHCIILRAVIKNYTFGRKMSKGGCLATNSIMQLSRTYGHDRCVYLGFIPQFFGGKIWNIDKLQGHRGSGHFTHVFYRFHSLGQYFLNWNHNAKLKEEQARFQTSLLVSAPVCSTSSKIPTWIHVAGDLLWLTVRKQVNHIFLHSKCVRKPDFFLLNYVASH